MELVKPEVIRLPQTTTFEETLQRVEKVARISYRSEDKIENKSYIPFCKMLLRRGHLSPFEQGTIYMVIKDPYYAKLFKENHYSKVEMSNVFDKWYVTTNLRVLRDMGFFNDDLQLEPIGEVVPYDSLFYERVTFKITTSIDIAREFNRHRANSINEASTRYIDNSNVKVVESVLFKDTEVLMKILKDDHITNTIEGYYALANRVCEICYGEMLELGAPKQLARKVLTLGTMTTMYHTAFIDDWIHFLDLRLADSAHPDIRVLAEKIKAWLGNKIGELK